jgi:hypothetical protein
MKAPQAPQLDERRTEEFFAELGDRAQAWIPTWGLADGERDFGRALLQIAARFSSEVAERLDRTGDKMRRGFLDWLGVPRKAARPARVPVVFKLADSAQEAVLAAAPVQMQVDAAGTPVVFETEADIRIVRGQVAVVVGVDATADAFYLPPPGLADLQLPAPQPAQWQLKSFAAAGAKKLQLDPEGGLAVDMIVAAGKAQYRITLPEPGNGIVSIDPPLDSELPESTVFNKVTNFAPFDGVARNRQEHALYLGHMDLLNIKSAATIDVWGAGSLATGIKWQYWGKAKEDGEIGWQPLTVAPTADQKPEALVLIKPEGSVDPKEIGEINSRWIRAYATNVEGEAPLLQVDELKISINCKDAFPPCPQAAGQVDPQPEVEAMANTTPLVLNSPFPFYPFGKEPRQFDTFYLGSQEAFSKKSAEVQLCFKMAEQSFAALSCLRAGAQLTDLLAGVASDGYLHLLQFNPASESLTPFPNREALHPPSPVSGGAAVEAPPVTLDPSPSYRIPIWKVGSITSIAVSARSAVWIWREDAGNPANSGWEAAGLVGDAAGSSSITALVYLDDAPAGRLFALRDSKLFVRNLNDANATWQAVTTQTPASDQVDLTAIAPILIENVDLRGGSVSEGLVGVDGTNKLYGIKLQNTPLKGTCTELLTDVSPDITPIAVRSTRLGNRLIAVAVGRTQPNRKLLAFLSTPSTLHEADHGEVDLDAVAMVGQSIDVNLTGGQLTFVTGIKPDSESTALVAWSPFDPDPKAVLFTTEYPPYVSTPAGAPTLLSRHIIVPTISSQVIVATFDVSVTGRLSFDTKLETALVTSAKTSQLAAGDQVAIPVSTVLPTHVLRTVDPGVDHRGETVYGFDVQSIDDSAFVYAAAAALFTGDVDPNDLETIKIDPGDNVTTDQSILLVTTDVSTDLYYVTDFDGTTKLATLDRDLNVNDPTAPPKTVRYKVPDPTTAKLLPLMRLTPATDGKWNAALLDRTQLVFPGAVPDLQSGTAFDVDPMGQPKLVVLSKPWLTAPSDVGGGKAKFIADNSVGAWVAQLGNTFTNPDLSWEYWNGKGWWNLDITRDETQNLKTTGVLQFDVPDDVASTDWAGKTNFWIRARLIGGDYGREKVTVTTKTLPDGSPEQTVNRSTEDIHAPSVLQLQVSYRVCVPVLPASVLAEDSGRRIDQSDANRTAGAIVEAFVPLSLMLDRLSNAWLSPEPAPECAPDCDRRQALTPPATVPAASTSSPATGNRPASGRSLFIGLNAAPSEAPIHLLFLVEERAHTDFATLTTEALVANRFEQVVSHDATRALSESGLLTMTFAIPPTPSDLFGQKGLTWLRLTPGGNASEGWKPALRGAYLNAVWASATETLTRELLGSSDGAPNMIVRLARPPVLYQSLELRVKEPLGEEERDRLCKENPASVISEVSTIGGQTDDWVLWKQVADPNDESPDARVYALDESRGIIRFGDGQHGMIPPIGRDSILAFKYKRTEPGSANDDTVPGNLVTARTPLNLVSPVATVESVTAADQAAGGAPPEDDDRVLRFGYSRVRHHDRAVTLQDLEDLTLESSPDIAQALAFAPQGSVRLIVVMSGKNPLPNAAQRRELRSYLLARRPVSLGLTNVLRIAGPQIRQLCLDLTLRVTSLDKAGALEDWVKDRFERFFDTSSGGVDGDGWQLGASPGENDVAYALLDAPDLESIKDVKLIEIAGDGSEQPWPAVLKPTELAMLAKDPLRIRFETAEEPI